MDYQHRSPTSAHATTALGRSLGGLLSGHAIVTLTGPLGSGKTTLVTGLVEGRGGSGVSSPTFVYHQRYDTPTGVIDHFDLYRVHQDSTLLVRTGITEYLADPPGLLLIEWPIAALHYPPAVPHLFVDATSGSVFTFRFGSTDPQLSRVLRTLP